MSLSGHSRDVRLPRAQRQRSGGGAEAPFDNALLNWLWNLRSGQAAAIIAAVIVTVTAAAYALAAYLVA